MQELEKLLNSLIKRGWKPFENSNLNHCNSDGKFIYFYTIRIPNRLTASLVYESLAVPLRLITTIESWLWQFVCDKELVQHKTSEKIIKRYVKEVIEREGWDIIEADIICTDLDPEYRLLESALIPEEELGKFLVDNIRINESLWTAD